MDGEFRGDVSQATLDAFALHVTTRHASLLCDRCDGGVRPRPHSYDRVDPIRTTAHGVVAVKVLFSCVQCGAVRQWGVMGRAWTAVQS